MADYTVFDFLDLQAGVDDGEGSDISEDELDRFFEDDNDTTESMSDWNARASSPAISNFERDADEMRALVASRRSRPSPYIMEDSVVPQHLLVPRDSDLPLWAICVKVGFETNLVFQIYRWATDDQWLRPHIASAFARDGIPGYIFVEGQREEIRAVMVTLVTILKSEPYLIPLEQRVALLLPRLPTSCLIKEGQWVRCLHGLYRNDIGFVCGHNPHSELDILVAFAARIPEPSSRGTKRKRVARPAARTWSVLEIEAVWGASQIQKKSTEEFVFCDETYCSGLIMKHVSSQSVAAVAHAPNAISTFIKASCIRNLPSFAPWVHRFVQDNIQPQQRVRIESGEQKGIIRRPFTINDSVATIVTESDDDTPPFDISLRSLSPHYIPGDNVKARWSDSYGMVILVHEDKNSLVYVEQNSKNEIMTPMDAVEPFEPPRLYHRFKEGVWVSFRHSMDRGHHPRRGYVKDVVETHATVIDEFTFTEFNIDTRDLEVCEVQGPSLLKSDPVHPLVDHSVIVSRGPLKGLYGRIKDVGFETLIVELEAKIAGSRNSRQHIKWSDLRLVPKTVEASRSTTDIRTRTPTPPPAPGTTPPRDLTPEPVGGSSGDHPHWVFSGNVRHVMQRKTIPFAIKHTHLGNGALGAYEGCVARSVPFDRRDICRKDPSDGEITVSVIKRSRRKLMSVNPKYLVPLRPIVGGKVIVVRGVLLGVVGVAKANQGKHWVVTFTMDDESVDQTLEEEDLAPLEEFTYF